VPLRRFLFGHEIVTAFELGWGTLQNGALLHAAEAEVFFAIVSTDQNLRYQQNLSARRLAVLVLMTTDWRLIRQHTGLRGAGGFPARAGRLHRVVVPAAANGTGSRTQIRRVTRMLRVKGDQISSPAFCFVVPRA
jgi:hypothetical protein